MLLKKAVNKFRGQISDGLSSTSENVRSASPRILREHLINRLTSAKSNSQQQQSVSNLIEVATSAASSPLALTTNTTTTVAAPVTSSTTSTSALISVQSATNVRTVEVKKRGGAGGPQQRSNSLEHKGQKWRLMRQKSQQMLKNLAPQPTAATEPTEPLAATSAVAPQPPAAVMPNAAVATNIMHDFNLSMSEYRSEIRENIAHLDAKINRLEAAILNLTEKMPLMVLQQTGQQVSRAKDNARK